MPVISTNTAANTALKYLNWNSDEQSANLARIASGSRITKASDDAAGLAIGTRMQTDVATLAQASTNAQHGEAVLSTADGGLSSINDILQRMKTLATQAVSGTVSDTELAYVQAELDELSEEIDDIAAATTFNGISLLDGSSAYSGTETVSFSETTEGGVVTGVTVDTEDASYDASANSFAINVTDTGGDVSALTISTDGGTTTTTIDALAYTGAVESDADSAGATNVAIDDTDGDFDPDATEYTFTITISSNAITQFDVSDDNGGSDSAVSGSGTSVDYHGISFDVGSSLSDGTYTVTVSNTSNGGWSEDSDTLSFDHNGVSFSIDTSSMTADADTAVGVDVSVSSGVTFMCGTSATDTLSVSIGDASADAIGVDTEKLDVETSDASRTATINAIDAAIDTISSMRADVGAQMSRFGYRADMLDTSSENIDAAASAIMDADIAEEQTNLAANEVKTQAAIAALAQANSLPSQLLNLLQ